MTTKIQLPGTAAGGDIAVSFNEWGFIEKGLQTLFMFDETGGTSFLDKMGGAPAGLASLSSSNNAFSRLANGGVQLEGAQIISAPTFDASQAWTLFAPFNIFDVTVEGTPRLYGLVGLRTWGESLGNVRGSAIYASSAARTDGTAYFIEGAAAGDGNRAAVANINSFIPVIGKTFLAAHSYNGTDTISSRVYDQTGLIGSASHAVTDDILFKIGSTTITSISPVIGGFSNSYDNGKTRFEAWARYNRPLSDFSTIEIGKLLSTSVALGSARGRAWA